MYSPSNTAVREAYLHSLKRFKQFLMLQMKCTFVCIPALACIEVFCPNSGILIMQAANVPVDLNDGQI